jgi:hypothetical protein
LDVTLSNCLQPIAILLPSVGSTEIEVSLAASPRIFWPLALTFTWILVNEANCEIIRGEVSITRGGAGGLSYDSGGTFRNWPKASGTKNGDSRLVKTLAFNILKASRYKAPV